jgi:hypothetical protein
MASISLPGIICWGNIHIHGGQAPLDHLRLTEEVCGRLFCALGGTRYWQMFLEET